LFYFTAFQYRNLTWEVNYFSVGKILSLLQSIRTSLPYEMGLDKGFFPEREMRN